MSATTRAALWMLGAIFSFTAMAIAGRELADSYDTFEIMMYRSGIGFAMVLGFAAVTGSLSQVKRNKLRLHGIRNVFHFTGQNLWFYAVTVVPLSRVFAFEFTTPLWVIVLSALFLGERLSLPRVGAAALGFIGILIVARPDTMGALNGGLVAAASCAIFFALTFVCTKRLTATQSVIEIMFYLTAMQLVFGLIAAGYDGDVAPPTAAGWPWLLVVAFCGLLAHTSISKALSLAPAAVVAPLDFARLPIIALVAVLLYDEAMDAWVFVGAVIIFAGNYLNIWSEKRKAA